VTIVQSCAGKLLQDTCQTDQQRWTNFIIWRSAQEGVTSTRNQFIPVLMDKWVEQHKKCEFQGLMTKACRAFKQEYPDEAKRGAKPLAIHVSMNKDLYDF